MSNDFRNSTPLPEPSKPLLVAESLRRGCALLAESDAEGAMRFLRPAYEDNPGDAQVRSHYGLALGLARGRYHEARELCQSAVKQEFFNPDLYLNIARLNLAYGFKSEALRYLRRARMIDPATLEAQAFFSQLGRRSPPVLRFLPRRHLLNRWLGSVRSVFVRLSEPWSPRIRRRRAR